ncbi:aminopeptidase [Loigolactobacillus coryniformis subsp. coryniformis]|uniref:C1 family peptidase n=1 Tax=Loigolactobacillus coryniformis TaxID=1610 RepID=UPI0002192365|nr:C1 family peptidase [Loigolactobacillus coryniformis]ATO55077.1 aminopeptidase [Loigolactobacillus coryniformis subsp. coryniformis KCTC 3167 = DSM 20001]OEH90529.1 aminopeptidase [Loigolactobacillus coryniformis subsp. coryniformis]
MSQEITSAAIADYQSQLQQLPQSATIKRAVMNNGILAASENTDSKVAMNQTFSVDLSAEKVANQKQSGRCWMFAALNTMRRSIADQFNLKDFELSQNYTNFWDKFEKSNYFYENILATATEPLESRKVAFLLATPQQDGGQWDMLTALIDKYGIVPKYVMPETYNSSKSSELNSVLNLKLRKDAVTLRQMVADKASEQEIATTKSRFLSEVYRILVYTLGEPPVKFDFEYRDGDKAYHIDRDLTPQTFFKKYVGWDLDNYQSIINAPTDDKPYNHLYTVEMLGNVVGGRQVRHLNLDIDTFKQLAIKQLQAGESVWFGSDVGQASDRQIGIMDTAIYNKDDLFNVGLSMTKAQRLDYGESLMTHAMVITGVDLVDDKPTKWKVENSWGDKVGEKGYFVMSDAWLDQYVYQIVINKQYLPADLLAATKEDPKVLAPWDPMGALASH